LDTAGQCREWLQWPLPLPPSNWWQVLPPGDSAALFTTTDQPATAADLFVWRFQGHATADEDGLPQTLLSAWNQSSAFTPLWIGLIGCEQRLGVLLSPQAGRSPHLWTGPALATDEPFLIELALHTGMGPGGLLWRWDDESPWSSLRGASAWGSERLTWPARWSVGHGKRGNGDRPFRGDSLRVSWHHEQLNLM